MFYHSTFLLLIVCLLSPILSFAQGLPLIRNFTAEEYGGHNRNFDVEIGDDGTVFVANFEGLLYYDRSQWRMIHTPNLKRATVLFRDRKNTIWVGGNNFIARLQKLPNGQLAMQQTGKGSFKGEVMNIFEDKGGLKFVASDNNLYQVQQDGSISQEKRLNVNFQASVDLDVASAEVLEGNPGDVVLETATQPTPLDGGLRVHINKNHGLTVSDDQGREIYVITEASGLCSNQVASVAYDGHGILWGATGHGIFAIELPPVYTYILPKDGLQGEVQAIAAYGNSIYAGGTNGLYSVGLRQNNGQSLCRRISEIDNICWALCQSDDGLLAATSSGIYRISAAGSVSRLTSKSTTALLVDGNRMYAAEPDGVYLYAMAGGRWSMANGQKYNDLPLVTEIRKDAHGGLWLKNVHGESRGTDPGKPRTPLAELPDYLYTPISDMKVTAQYQHGSQVWVGGDEILTVVDTGKKDLSRLSASRTIRFRSIVISGDSVLWGGYGDMPESLPRLDSDCGNLHFFYALDYAPLTGQTLFRYRLNKDQWSAWSPKRDVEFLNLPSGSFTLSVQARLANGELSEVASVSFRIDYPLPMRWYMVALYFLAFAYLVYLLFRYRLKRLQRDKLKLERTVEERTSEIVKQRDEIEEKSKSLEKALDDLSNAQNELIRQEKMASVGKLTEGLIDRIQNPMNYIINFSKMSVGLLDDLKTDIVNNKANISEADYEDTEELIGMLTENLNSVDHFGQSTSRTLKAMEEMLKDRSGGYTDTDLLPLLQQSEQLLGHYFAQEKDQYHIQTCFALPDSAMLLHGNPGMLTKAIMNMLDNAVYAIVRKAKKVSFSPVVTLTANVEGDQYVVKIRDNGIGIEATILNKIFDPFFTTKTTGEAAGVGLYLSREIIQNHGGDISVASVQDEYAEFTIHLPKSTSP